MITVLLPTYNLEKYIVCSINCLLQQTIREFELLVLDDGSDDNTEEKVTSIKDSRIVYKKSIHQGLASTLNYGLKLANYDIIARMDADDLCVKWRLERQLGVLLAMSRNTIISSWYGIFQEYKLNYLVKTPINSAEIKKGLLLHSYIAHPGLMFYKEHFTKVGGYQGENNEDAFEDYRTWLKIKDRTEFHIIPEILIYQRHRVDSLSNHVKNRSEIIYSMQKPFYENLKFSFKLYSIEEQLIFKGWREYFYGDKKTARYYWKKLHLGIFLYPRVLVGYIITYSRDSFFNCFKEARIKYRVKYYLTYFSMNSRIIRKNFTDLIRSN